MKRYLIVAVVISGILLGVLPLSMLEKVGIDFIPVASATALSDPIVRCLPCKHSVEGIQPPPSLFRERHCNGCHVKLA